MFNRDDTEIGDLVFPKCPKVFIHVCVNDMHLKHRMVRDMEVLHHAGAMCLMSQKLIVLGDAMVLKYITESYDHDRLNGLKICGYQWHGGQHLRNRNIDMLRAYLQYRSNQQPRGEQHE